jgi:hypothetical protein
MSGFNVVVNTPYSGQSNVLVGDDDGPYIFVQVSVNSSGIGADEPASVTSVFAGIYLCLADIPIYKLCSDLTGDSTLAEQDDPDPGTSNWSFDEVSVPSTDPTVTQYVQAWACLSDGSAVASSPNSFTVGGS